MFYIIFYSIISLFIPLTLRGFNYETTSGKFGIIWTRGLFIAFIATTLLRGYAYETGQDYWHYWDYYLNIANGRFDDWGEHTELGYRFLVRVLSYLSDSPYLFFISSSIVVFTSMLYVSQRQKQAAPYIMLLWWPFMFGLSYNLYRQYFAISFILIAFYAFYDKKTWMSVVFVILALLFHTSSVVPVSVIIGIIYLSRYKINKWILIGAVILTTIYSHYMVEQLALLGDNLTLFYAAQTGQVYESTGILETLYEKSSLVYINLLQYVVWIWYGDKYVEEHEEHRTLFYIMSISLILIPITRQEILMRLCHYFVAFSPIFIGLMCSDNKYRKKLPFILSLVYLFLYHFYGMYVMQKDFPLIYKF